MDNSFLHSKKLLLVDDEQELLKMVSDILKDAGFETVLTAMTVKEAILTAKEDTPDLIVLDVMLPDGDGFSLMQQLRTFTNVPIIFLTAKDEAADKLSGLGLGADVVRLHPCDPGGPLGAPQYPVQVQYRGFFRRTLRRHSRCHPEHQRGGRGGLRDPAAECQAAAHLLPHRLRPSPEAHPQSGQRSGK